MTWYLSSILEKYWPLPLQIFLLLYYLFFLPFIFHLCVGGSPFEIAPDFLNIYLFSFLHLFEIYIFSSLLVPSLPVSSLLLSPLKPFFVSFMTVLLFLSFDACFISSVCVFFFVPFAIPCNSLLNPSYVALDNRNWSKWAFNVRIHFHLTFSNICCS